MTRLKLVITVEDDAMVLSRILQVVSRRGFQLSALTSELIAGQQRRYHCELEGDSKWQKTLPPLIAKLASVREVKDA